MFHDIYTLLRSLKVCINSGSVKVLLCIVYVCLNLHVCPWYAENLGETAAVSMMDVFTQSGDQHTDTFATPAAPIIA